MIDILKTWSVALAIMLLPQAEVLGSDQGPPWEEKGPRILFNINDFKSIPEIIPNIFWLGFWHSPTTTIVFNRWRRMERGHLLGSKSVHGEEYGYLAKGRLVFVLDESREHVVVEEGELIRWPNIAHWGTCMTEECLLYALFTPTRDDYGPEGTPMTAKSNVWINDAAAESE